MHCKLLCANIPPLDSLKILWKEDTIHTIISVRWALNPRTISPRKLMSPTPGRKCCGKSALKNIQWLVSTLKYAQLAASNTENTNKSQATGA